MNNKKIGCIYKKVHILGGIDNEKNIQRGFFDVDSAGSNCV